MENPSILKVEENGNPRDSQRGNIQLVQKNKKILLAIKIVKNKTLIR